MSTVIPAPQAPDLDTVFDVEGGIDGPLVRAIYAAGVIDVDPARSSQEQRTPRVESQLWLGACTARQKVTAGATDRRLALPTRWKCRLVLTIATDRADPKQAGAHEQYRAKVRSLGAQFMTRLNPWLPYHRFEELEEMGTTLNMVNEEARTEDISRIEYHGEISVRDTAWPVGIRGDGRLTCPRGHGPKR